jgi:YggT family protein
MILFGNLLMGLGQVLSMVLNLVLLLVFISVVLSWLRLDPYHPLVNYIHTVAESLYRLPRKYFKTVFGQIDLAPMIVVIAAYFLQTVLVNSLLEYGYELKQSALLGSRRMQMQEQLQDVLPGSGKGRRL